MNILEQLKVLELLRESKGVWSVWGRFDKAISQVIAYVKAHEKIYGMPPLEPPIVGELRAKITQLEGYGNNLLDRIDNLKADQADELNEREGENRKLKRRLEIAETVMEELSEMLRVTGKVNTELESALKEWGDSL